MKIHVITGGQAGSEGKGHIAGILAADARQPTCIRVAGPNAGHSVVNPLTGVKHPLRTIPVGAVTNPDARLCIAAGSEIDLSVLATEIATLEADGVKIRERLVIDPAATILTEEHIEREKNSDLTARLGSTSKGIGAARADRIMRLAQTARDVSQQLDEAYGRGTVQPVADYAHSLGFDIHIEGTQGYQLGLHTANYPQVTSSDTTAIAFLAMAQVNPWWVTDADLRIWIVYRPYPIRVAGNSGPLHGETSWEDLGLPEELTTVTKKRRRVGTWDHLGARDAMIANGPFLDGPTEPLRFALTMADQIDPWLAGKTDPVALVDSDKYQDFLDGFYLATGSTPHLVTTSDRTHIRPRGDY